MTKPIKPKPAEPPRCMGCGRPSLTAFCDTCAPPDPSLLLTNNTRKSSPKTMINKPAGWRGYNTREHKKPEE